jgi:peptidyl-prolyl cis-trans isomerase-like 4
MDQLEGMSQEEIDEYMKEREARTRAKLLEIIGDLPDADMKPPENVLFVCKLNPVTNDEDLELIFSRFGKINSCEVIRDRKSGDSLCYAFIEFDREEDCENAYFKMDNVLIDDRRIHVDFSQSVSKVNWKGKGTGTGYFEDNKDFMSKDEKKPKYKINTKSRKEEGYDLILGNDSDKEDKKEKRYESVGRKNYQNNKPNYINQRRNDSNDKGRDFNNYNRSDDRDRYGDSKKYKYDSEYNDRYKSDRDHHHHYNRDRTPERKKSSSYKDRESKKYDKNYHKKKDENKSSRY